MALKFGSTDISSSYTPKFNSTALKSIKYGSTEVWKSEVQIYPGATPVAKFAIGGIYGDFYSRISGVANGNATMVGFQVDVTNYKKIIVYGSFHADKGHEYNGAGVGLYTSLGTDYWNQHFYYSVGHFINNSVPMITAIAAVKGGESAEYLELDVSNITGTYWLAIGAYSNTLTSYAEVTSITATT